MARVVAQGDLRPMQGNAEAMEDLKRILAAREPLYRKADATLDTSGETPQQSLARLRQLVHAVTASRRLPWLRQPTPWRPRNAATVVHLRRAPGPLRALEALVRRPGRDARRSTSTRTAASRPATSSSSTPTTSASTSSSHDALQRLRFEHPEVRARRRDQRRATGSSAPAPTSSCSALSSHAWKVNFCKFTNETRNGIEDASRHSGLKFVAACNGTTAGGGYELALACDEILLVDDRSSAVSLPEVPLLGVLPGTGGLTRVTDKRQRAPRPRRRLLHAGRGRARAARAGVAADRRPREAAAVRRDGARSARRSSPRLSDRPQGARGVALTPLARTIDDAGYHYEHVDVRIDRGARARDDHRRARPHGAGSRRLDGDRGRRRGVVAARDGARARRRDPAAAHQRARARHVDPRRPTGDAAHVLAADAALARASRRTGSSARRSACCAARSRGSTSPRARSSR